MCCEDSTECKTPIIKEGSPLIIYINGDEHSEVEDMEEIKIQPNSINILDECCSVHMDINQLKKRKMMYTKKIDSGKIAFFIKDGKTYEPASNAN